MKNNCNAYNVLAAESVEYIGEIYNEDVAFSNIGKSFRSYEELCYLIGIEPWDDYRDGHLEIIERAVLIENERIKKVYEKPIPIERYWQRANVYTKMIDFLILNFAVQQYCANGGNQVTFNDSSLYYEESMSEHHVDNDISSAFSRAVGLCLSSVLFYLETERYPFIYTSKHLIKFEDESSMRTPTTEEYQMIMGTDYETLKIMDADSTTEINNQQDQQTFNNIRNEINRKKYGRTFNSSKVLCLTIHPKSVIEIRDSLLEEIKSEEVWIDEGEIEYVMEKKNRAPIWLPLLGMIYPDEEVLLSSILQSKIDEKMDAKAINLYEKDKL